MLSVYQQTLNLTEEKTGLPGLERPDDMKVLLQTKILDHSQRWIREGTETSFTLKSVQDQTKYLTLNENDVVLETKSRFTASFQYT